MTDCSELDHICSASEQNVGLTNSFGLDVAARYMLRFDSVERLRRFASTDYVRSGGRWMVLSGGNNVLFCSDYNGVIIHPVGRTIEIVNRSGNDVYVRVEAGVEWDDFVGWCVERNFWGVENLSLIPGYVGAAPIQNIGAYGAEAANAVSAVEVFDMTTREVRSIDAADCCFAYRESIFKHELRGRVVVVSVLFRLSTIAHASLDYGDLRREVETLGDATLANIRRAVISIRRNKLPDPAELGNAGSFFKNPVVDRATADRLTECYADMPTYASGEGDRVKLAAGWLIEKAGYKGRRHGNVGVHNRQALVLVNYGGATGQEIITFASEIRAAVKQMFGITLDFEVNIIE